MAASRLIAMPLLQVGAALLLEHDARPGWLGSAADFVRVLAGKAPLAGTSRHTARALTHTHTHTCRSGWQW